MNNAALLNGEICRLLLEHAPTAVAVFDREMRYLSVSGRWSADHAIDVHEIIGKSYYEAFPATDDRCREVHRRVLAGESMSNCCEPLRWQNGSIHWAKWTMIPWMQSDDEIGGAIMFTETLDAPPAQSREQLLALDAELNLLINNTQHTAICLLDSEGRIAAWNDGAERMFGWSAGEIIGKPCTLLFCENDRDSASPAALSMQATQQPPPYTKTWRKRKDGKQLSGTSEISQILDDQNVLIGFGMAFHDTTEEDEQLARIEAREAQLSSILETVPDAMVTTDEFGIIESFSAAAERLFGYEASEVIGRSVGMLMPEPDASHHDGYLARYRETGKRRVIGSMRRVFGRRKDGSLFPHEIYIGEASGGGRRIFTGFVRDLTSREQAAAEMQLVQAELIQISRVTAIGTMATALAHDLNQPLTAITNYVQAASAMMATAEGHLLTLVREVLDECGRQAMRAGDIVRHLRAFVSREEPGRTQETLEDIVADACAITSLNGSAHGVSCEIDIPRDVADVVVDRVQIQQVLINLIQNAIEAMGADGLLCIGAQQRDGMVQVTVRDSGPGIPAGEESKLFEPFVSSKSGGMGLGLAICRTIVEAHGGKAWCANAREGGAEFHFTLPVGETTHE